MIKRFMFDSMVYDKIAAADLVDKINDLSAGGKIIIYTTHVQEDELSRIPGKELRKRIAKLKQTPTPTSATILGVSKLGKSCLGDGAVSGLPVGSIRLDKGGHAADALIASTAASQAYVFVTEDERLGKRVKKLTNTIAVWSFSEFKVWLDKQQGPRPSGIKQPTL